MRMNAGIIMAGQNPDFAQSYGQGYQLGRQNAFKTLAEQYGAKAMEGDKEALNAFAAFDPQMGMGLAASRQNMDVQSERLQMARAEAARAAERHAMTMDATERKMQAEKIGRGIATVVPAIQSGNLEAVNQQLRTFNMQPVGSIDEARLLVAQYDGAYEAFTRLDAMKPKAVEPEYEYRNGQYIQLNAPGGPRPVDVPGLNPEPQDRETLMIGGDLYDVTDFKKTGDPADLVKVVDAPADEYERYVADERANNREPMTRAEWKELGSTKIDIDTGNQDLSEFAKVASKHQAAFFDSLYQNGLSQGANIAQLNELEGLLASETSPEGFEAALKSKLGDFGIETEGLSALQAARAIINRMVPQQRPPGSGPMSDADLELFKQSLPRLINTREGNVMIARTLRGIARYQQQQAAIANKVLSLDMTPAEGRDALMALENPLQDFKKATAGGATIGVEIDAETQKLIDGYAKDN